MMVHSLFPQRSQGLSFLQILELFLPGFGNVLISITFSRNILWHTMQGALSETLIRGRGRGHLVNFSNISATVPKSDAVWSLSNFSR